MALLKSFYIEVGKKGLVNGLYQEKPMGKEIKVSLPDSKLSICFLTDPCDPFPSLEIFPFAW